MVPNHEKNEDYYENPCLSHCQTNFNSKENYRKKSFSYETKALMPFLPISLMSFSAQTLKENRLLWESLFSLIDGQTLILWKMVEGKALLKKPKH